MSRLTRGEEKDVFTVAPAGHSLPVRIVDCVSYHEWIELYNGSGQALDLAGWMLDDEEDATADAAAASLQSSKPYVIPAGAIIEPGRFLLFFRRDTRLALNNTGDEVRFLGPDGVLLDAFAYGSSPGVDVSWSRAGDGAGSWTTGYPPSPGASNRPPPPTATATPVPPLVIQEGVNTPIHLSIEIARTYPLNTWLIVEGQVTVAPPHFGRSLYIQDHTEGILVSLGQGEFPSLAEGDWLRVDGRLRNYHGERRLWVSRSTELQRTGAGEPVQPQVIRSGQVDEAHEGLLVQVFGPAVSFGSQSFHVDDGSGVARVYVRDSVAFRRPSIHVGELWSVVGIVSQYVVSAPHEGGYRLLPRYETDLSTPPLLLPVTGGDRTEAGHDSLSGRTDWRRRRLTPWQSKYDQQRMKPKQAKSKAYLPSKSMVAATLPWNCLLCRNRHELFAFWQ